MRPGRVDLAMYLQAVPLLLRHPSVFVAPLLGAVVYLLLVGEIAPRLTDPLGGIGSGLFSIVAQVVYGFAFGVAIIAANDIWRQRRVGFDSAWEEGRGKAGGIIIATIGFFFIIYVAELVGSFFGILGLVLPAVAAFFLIYTIPAAAIGGMPGQFALGASIRAARDAVVPTIVLAIVFIFLFYILPNYLLPLIGPYMNDIVYKLAFAILQAIVLAYLAFPFAKQYDDIAFTRRW